MVKEAIGPEECRERKDDKQHYSSCCNRMLILLEVLGATCPSFYLLRRAGGLWPPNLGHTFDYVPMVEYMKDLQGPEWIFWDGALFISIECNDMSFLMCIPFSAL